MDTINKKELSETDICDLFITPAIKDAGWDHMRQIRREVTLTPGPVIVRGNFNPEAYDVAKVNVELMKYLRWSRDRSLTWEAVALEKVNYNKQDSPKERVSSNPEVYKIW